MLTVDDYELIRRKYFIDGMSQRQIARELGHGRETVAKAIEHALPPGYRLSQPRGKPVIKEVSGIIEAWLDQDKTRPRKQRHTAQRIYERLRDEHGFTGHASTVRRYVASVKNRRKEVFFPLEFEPGQEAQVDWHEGQAVVNGQQRKLQFFCMRLCHSKASFVWAYERADLISFLDGHVRALAYFGGVPHRIAYDNLKSAVIQVMHGKERRLNERFIELRSWYLFDSRFCNIARGNEKGDVENLAKRSERTYLTPLPEVASLEELNAHLLAGCGKDLTLPGPDPHGDQTRAQLLEEERRVLRPLPEAPYEACQHLSTFIDKQSLVTVDTNHYSAPVRWAHHRVTIRKFVDRVELWCEQQLVAEHTRGYRAGQYVLTPEHYLPLLATKPGGLDNARAFKGQPWPEDFNVLRRELEYRYEGEGTRKFIRVLLLMTEHSEDQVKHAVSQCIHRRAFSDEAVEGVLRNGPVRASRRLDLSHRPDLQTQGDGVRPAGLYDELRSVAAEEVAA